MARTAALAALPVVLVATAWLRLEDPDRGGSAAAVVVLAVLPALVRPWWGRALAALVAALVVAEVAFDVSPLDARPFSGRDFWGPLLSHFREGFLEYYDVPQPFATGEQPLMHGVVLTAIFGFTLAVSLAIAARRPVLASATLLVASVWPATLVPADDLERGALTLAAVLVLLALGGRRPTRAYRPALAAGAVLVAAAVAASTSTAVAKDAFVEWKDWDLYDKPADPVGVDYVWNANYAGIEFPEKETRVLTIQGPKRNLYWRAATLDDFKRDRWVENLNIVGFEDGFIDVTGDSLFPRRGRNRERWVRATVKVEALRDDHLVGPSMPAAYETGGLGTIAFRAGGVAVRPGGLQRGDEYTVSAYAPRPRPRQLARVRPDPERQFEALDRYLEVAPGRPMPRFGARDRELRVADLFDRSVHAPVLASYRRLYDRARDVVGTPRNQYAAVVALEAWFRTEGGFRYDEQPPAAGPGTPPLVAFVLGHQRGYCQLYAGAMALMLRYLGIPARVAVGFTSGDPNDRGDRWTVTDRDAHAWVEVWFRGWGWLPFDPTPARGQLSNPYSYGSLNFDVDGAAVALGGPSAQGFSSSLVDKLSELKAGERFRGPDVPGRGSFVFEARERGASLLKLLLVVAAAVAAAIVLLKLALRKARYVTGDPRRVAAACRRELVDFLADQGIRLPASATPQELGAEIERLLGVEPDRFVQALAAARFARPDDAGPAVRRARRELRRLRRQIRARLGPVSRARGAVSLRSLAA